MIRTRRRSTAALLLTGDLIATTIAFFLAWFVRFELEIPALTKGVPPFHHYLLVLPAVLVLWPLVFYFHGLYQGRRDRSRIDDALAILLAAVVATVLFSGVLAWLRPIAPDGTPFTFSRAFMGHFLIAQVAIVLTARVSLRTVLRHLRRKGHNVRRILIVGAGHLGKEITRKIQAHRELGFAVVGFLDDDPNKAKRRFLDVPVVGQLQDVEQVIQTQAIDHVYIALPPEAHGKVMRLMEVVSRSCVEVKLVPDVLQYATLNASLEDLDGLPVINLSQVPLKGWNSLMKRTMDVIIAGAALLALSPLFLLLAWLIKREDRGPVFFRQERMGLDGKSFMILKFRSMGVNAEATTGPVWAVRDDPRRTRIGSFLRRTSFDELPQLWNVLKGEMSIVGPRPERPTFVHEFKHKIPDYMLRHRVKAGITGWAQVHGWRGNTSIRKRIQYDLYYIQNWSLLLDFKIVWMTLRGGIWYNAY
ncbi:MAG: undecaprenyl-phosphate glucose phosphotransferase [Acidobacteriota bacterium]